MKNILSIIMQMVLIVMIMLMVFRNVLVISLTVELGVDVVLSSMQTGNIMDRPNTKWISKDGTISIIIGGGSDIQPWSADEGLCTIHNNDIDETLKIGRATQKMCAMRMYTSSETNILVHIYLLSDDSFVMNISNVYHTETLEDDFPFIKGRWIEFYRVDE